MKNKLTLEQRIQSLKDFLGNPTEKDAPISKERLQAHDDLKFFEELLQRRKQEEPIEQVKNILELAHKNNVTITEKIFCNAVDNVYKMPIPIQSVFG